MARLDKKFEPALVGALMDCWQAIGCDVEDGWRWAGCKPSNAYAYEAILDAGHLEMYGCGYDGKDEEARTAIKALRELPWKTQNTIARRLLGRLV